MASLNKVLLIGNLTKDPEVRFTPAGKAVGELRIAVSRKYKAGDGQLKEETCFVSVVVWGPTAQNCQQYLQKGRPVLVDGRLQYEEWEKDGKKFNRLRVVAENVQFLGGRPGSGGSEGDAGAEGGRVPVRDEADASPVAGGGGAADDDNLPF